MYFQFQAHFHPRDATLAKNLTPCSFSDTLTSCEPQATLSGSTLVITWEGELDLHSMRIVEAGRHVEDTGQRPFVGEFVKVENLGPIALQINNIKL